MKPGPRCLPAMLSAKAICALAITEPGGGSDVAAITTKAVRDGEDYVVNGSKTFITSGMRADYVTTAVRTGGPGPVGISLIVIPGETAGLTRTPLDKMGWWASDTATLYFEDCRVPARYLLGTENSGFRLIMENFNYERLFMIAGMARPPGCASPRRSHGPRSAETFGARLADHQVIRHKLVEMDRQINATTAWMEQLAWRVNQGETPAAELAECKVQASSRWRRAPGKPPRSWAGRRTSAAIPSSGSIAKSGQRHRWGLRGDHARSRRPPTRHLRGCAANRGLQTTATVVWNPGYAAPLVQWAGGDSRTRWSAPSCRCR
jgi:hypothetical protein